MDQYNIMDGKIHTSEAYFRSPTIIGDDLIIPYVNLGVRRHPLNSSNTMMYIDKCYIGLFGVSRFEVYKSDPIIFEKLRDDDSEIYLGGLNLDRKSPIVDMSFRFNHGTLFFPNKSKITESFWIPIDTPNYKANIKEAEVQTFFNPANFPGLRGE